MRIAISLVAFYALFMVDFAYAGSHFVRGHVTKKGSYVQPHRATNRNQTKRDNWSQKGNINPYNGKQGTKNN